MNRDLRILKLSLLAGSLYFLAVSAVHMLGSKSRCCSFISTSLEPVPGPHHFFLAFGWAVFCSPLPPIRGNNPRWCGPSSWPEQAPSPG